MATMEVLQGEEAARATDLGAVAGVHRTTPGPELALVCLSSESNS